MRTFGLIGYPLSHSFSPNYFSEKFIREKIIDCEYLLYPLKSVEELPRILGLGVEGLNVTLPYKESVLPYMDWISDEAKAVGAVNTICIKDRQISGYNTDVFGFELSLVKWLKGVIPNKALVLGSGGAAKAVAYVLDRLAVQYKVVSRTKGDISYKELKNMKLDEFKLIVNTTPLGMHPLLEVCPDINYKNLTENHFLYDLIYNPEKSLFLKRGEKMGSGIKNGMEMLILQAEKSWEIWNQSKREVKNAGTAT